MLILSSWIEAYFNYKNYEPLGILIEHASTLHAPVMIAKRLFVEISRFYIKRKHHEICAIKLMLISAF